MNISDIIQLGILSITIVGLFSVIHYNRKQFKIINQQLGLNFFAEYTKRYQKVLLELPLDINSEDFSIDSINSEDREYLIKILKSYFDLCSEEYFLWKNNFIDNTIWNEWKDGIEFAFNKPAFKQAWAIIDPDSKFYPDFHKWITTKVNND